MKVEIILNCRDCQRDFRYNASSRPQLSYNKDTETLFYSKTEDPYKCDDCGSNNVHLKII